MRNVDQIKALKSEAWRTKEVIADLRKEREALERELGRYRKKAEDDAKRIGRLSEELKKAVKAMNETHSAMNAIQAATVLRYGQAARDPDDASVTLGWNMRLPRIGVEELLGKYEVHARVDEETGECIIGVVEREAER